MTLHEFRELTKHLPGELQLLAAGGGIELLWHDEQYVSVDDDGGYRHDLKESAKVLFVDSFYTDS